MPIDEARIRGGLLGLLIGDATGVPYEFKSPAALPPRADIDMIPPRGFMRAHASAPPGAWSDDGAQALCLLASLLERRRLDLEDLGRRLLAWRRDGYMAVEGKVFDIGVATSVALDALESGVPAVKAGPTHERSNGNGSLMRVLPLALWHVGDDEDLIRDAEAQSRVTHGHLRSRSCCALYCLWARRVLQDHPAAWDDAVMTLRRLRGQDASTRRELDGPMRLDAPPGGSGSGYVVDCLHSARLAVEAGRFEAVVKTAISLGDDTDTTAAVAGGIAGLRDGVGAIPSRWLQQLAGRELYEPLVDELCTHRREADR